MCFLVVGSSYQNHQNNRNAIEILVPHVANALLQSKQKKNKMSKGSQKFSPPNERTANIPLYAETDEKSANKMDEEPN